MTKQLEKRITEAAQAYYLGTNCMPDSEYDLLVDKLRKVDPNNKVLKSVGADISTTPWPIVTHRRPMGSLHKVNTEEDYRKWAIKYTSGIICVSEKLDGLSISLNYENGRLVQGVTRGNGEKGEDITVNLKLLKGAVTTLTGKYAKGRHEIRGEAILLTADYKKYFPRKELESGLVENANARNCAACIRRKHDNTDVKHVSFIAYDISSDSFNPVTKEEVFIEIKSLGFKVPFYKVGSIDKIWGIFEEYKNSKRAQIDYEIDGLVAEDDDREKFKEAGESHRAQRPQGPSNLNLKLGNLF